ARAGLLHAGTARPRRADVPPAAGAESRKAEGVGRALLPGGDARRPRPGAGGEGVLPASPPGGSRRLAAPGGARKAAGRSVGHTSRKAVTFTQACSTPLIHAETKNAPITVSRVWWS